ncbi:hypothetical protein H0H81_007678 [Sphagnurus paluster]|uniref:Uncharacterized protein n=1 Tax=Sphagnurus paluster TaxID=117069 RepID=A0A9P7FQY6_9AGAR|nr:hypothetical protein H0H81_007678 [Sphagnurus paluster]
MGCNIMELAQRRLAERSILINEFEPAYLSRISREKPLPYIRHDLRILEIIAACIANGEPGGAVAAAFDKRKPFTLVLAKTIPILPQDHTTAASFLAILSKEDKWIHDVLPFILVHRTKTVNEQFKQFNLSMMTEHFDELIIAGLLRGH